MFRKASSFLPWLCLLLPFVACGAPPIRIAIVYAESETNPSSEITRAAAQAPSGIAVDIVHPGEHLQNRHDVIFADETAELGHELEAEMAEAASHSAVLVARRKKSDARNNASEAESYWRNPSQENYSRLFVYLASKSPASGNRFRPQPALVYPAQSFYHPDAPTFFPDFASYRRWYESESRRHRYDARRFNIGISFSRSYYTGQNLAHIDALIRAIERNGANAVPFMSKGGPEFDPYLMNDGKAVVDVLLYGGERLNYSDYQAGLAQARKLDVPLLSVYLHHRMTVEQYEASDTGLAPGMTANLVDAERDGVFEPLVVGARPAVHGGGANIQIIERQVEWRVRRALAWAKLRRTPNKDKKIVFTFWSEGGGKANAGGDPDDFLDVPGSVAKLLREMDAAGYNAGDPSHLPSPEALALKMSRDASNVGNWAPGELERRARRGAVALVPAKTYEQWFSRLPEKVQRSVTAQWGPPPGKIMVYRDGRGERFLAIPKLQWGNVLIAPHPDWGYLQDKRALLSTGALPPHHQYLAFFLWLQNEWHADAWVSLFSNIVLQEGKAEGPSADDPVGLLLGAIPHIHPEKLGTNGGMSNKRKALALTPGWFNAVVPSGAGQSLSELRARLARYGAQSDPSLRKDAEGAIREKAEKQGLGRALGVDVRTVPFERLAAETARYVAEVEREQMPEGSHVLGSVPDEETVHAMAANMVEGRTGNTPQSQALSADYQSRLRSGPRETAAILEALEGHRVEPGPMDEPLRDPDALPAGRALYNFNQNAMPTPEAEATGMRLANALIADYRAKHNGEFPRKLGLVLWSGEIAKTHGAMEAEVLALLGARPVRDGHGNVVDVELLTRAELGRPRVDVLVTTSGTYRDHYGDKIELMEKAAQLASQSAEADNPVSENTRASFSALLAKGESSPRANQLAQARIFAPAPNAYSPSIQFLAKAGDQRGSDATMAELYIGRFGHAYGGGLHGQAARPAFEQNLKTMGAAVLSRSDHINGVLDDPMPAGFLGGMNMAAKAVNGGKPADLYINDLREPTRGNVETLDRTLHRELTTRYLNPAWIEAMKQHGYDGARYMMDLTDNLALWDTTAPASVASQDWQQIKNVYVDDSKDLQLRQFFAKNNPFAEQVILANLMQVAARGDWQASASDLAAVARRLTESAAKHGIVCEANVCRNDKLTQLVEHALQNAPDRGRLLSSYHAALDRARLPARDRLAQAPALRAGGSPKPANVVTGRALETVAPPSAASSAALKTDAKFLLIIGLCGTILFGFGWLRHRQFSR